MDDIDRKAISLLMDATLMSEDEIERTLKILRNMARIKKKGKEFKINKRRFRLLGLSSL